MRYPPVSFTHVLSFFEQVHEFLKRPQPLARRDVAHVAEDAVDGEGGEGFPDICEFMHVDEKLHVPAHVLYALAHCLNV